MSTWKNSNFLANPKYCILNCLCVRFPQKMFPFGRRGVFKKSYFFGGGGHAALVCGILVPGLGIKTMPPAVESQSPVTIGPPGKSLSPLIITVPGTEQECRG